ncbi:MAG: Hvo_1808 family surface protein [Actinomycetota bacterium]
MLERPSPLPPAPTDNPPSRLPRVLLAGLLAVSLAAGITAGVRLSRSAPTHARSGATNAAGAASSQSESSASGTALSFGSSTIERIAHAVESLRGLKFKRGISPEVLTPEALRKRIEGQYQQEKRKKTEDTGKVLKTLGLLAPTDDLFDILLKVNTEQIGGYYDNKTKKLVVGGSADNLTPYQRVLTAHELTHALTDQYYDLGRLDQLSKAGKDDEQTAFLSLVEGDATLTMALYRERFLTPAEQQQVDAESAGQTSTVLSSAPPIVRKSLLFPYEKGVSFVAQLIQHGGTTEINHAYENPPTSTEQIIHPNKFFSRDEPVMVTMPNILGALGPAWKPLDTGGMGELDMQILVAQFLSPSDATAAAEGWGGGRYAAFESAKGTLVAISTVWDSEDQARICAEKMTEWLQPRFNGKGSQYRDGNTSGWDAGSADGEVTRTKTSVTIVLGPDRDSVSRTRKSFGA